MDLTQAFAQGLTPADYEQSLDEKQRDLHALYRKRAKVSPEDIERVAQAGPMHVLVITEPWCGDSLAIFPVVLALFEAAGSEVRVALRDKNPDLMDRYLTNGGRAIPIVVVLDEAGDERFHWGPRPAPAQAIVEESREAVAAGTTERIDVHKKVRAFYAGDSGKTIVEELRALLAA
ncbi:thioredoxin family protein [Candidatus Bipolaricaulota bacterium]|nr:thioredoxin family protein [Candidatus Bipolaricaulota bacterium]